MKNKEGQMAVFDTKVFPGNMRDIGLYGVLAQANYLATRGMKAGQFDVQIRIPSEMEKSRWNSIRNHTKKAVAILEENDFEVLGLHIDGGVSSAIKVPEVVVSAMGTTGEKELLADALLTARAGQDIVLVGTVGLEGMLRIIGEKEAELRKRFTPAFVRQMKSYDAQLCGTKVLNKIQDTKVVCVEQISEGGILAALWNLAKQTEKGLSLDMKKISVKQETIEVCEYFRLNPYQLVSNGSFLVVCEQGEALVELLQRDGLEASVIGQLTDNNDKKIHNGEDVRFIDRPAPDELFKIW